jgi:hypothetical protein
VVVGSLATIAGNVLLNWLQGRKEKALDEARKKLLREMLMERDWRNLSTLSRVIGADYDETRRLLIAISARGQNFLRMIMRRLGDNILSQNPITSYRPGASNHITPRGGSVIAAE